MPLITHDRTPSNVTLSIDALEAQLADMRADLEALYSQIREGKFEDLRDATRATSEIRQWLRIAIEAETQLEKRREKELGVAGAYALDLDEARESVGCRLARLRRARDAERVSGQPE